MIDVINAGSGMNTASREKFPRSVLPGTFDFGFATGLMVKDVRLALEEMKQLGLSMEVADAVGRLWETVHQRGRRRVRFHRGDQADREEGGRRGGRQATELAPTRERSADDRRCAVLPGSICYERRLPSSRRSIGCSS